MVRRIEEHGVAEAAREAPPTVERAVREPSEGKLLAGSLPRAP
jgi:hypothetical protein